MTQDTEPSPVLSKNGPHYHTMMIEWDGNHMGTHYSAGEPVPEPWNSVYFGS